MMNNDNIQKLEQNIKFKKKILSKDIWKNKAILPPSVIIFGGLFGIVYLMNLNLLISLYTIPFVILFAIGTIWIKSSKRYIVNQKLEKKNPFLICLALPLDDTKRKDVVIFCTSKNKLNRYYLEKKRKEILAKEDAIQTSLKHDEAPKPLEHDLNLAKLRLKKKSLSSINDQYYIIYTGQQPIQILSQTEARRFL